MAEGYKRVNENWVSWWSWKKLLTLVEQKWACLYCSWFIFGSCLKLKRIFQTIVNSHSSYSSTILTVPQMTPPTKTRYITRYIKIWDLIGKMWDYPFKPIFQSILTVEPISLSLSSRLFFLWTTCPHSPFVKVNIYLKVNICWKQQQLKQWQHHLSNRKRTNLSHDKGPKNSIFRVFQTNKLSHHCTVPYVTRK